jgi:hypothetical protein
MSNSVRRSLAFPPRPNGRGGLQTVEGVESVEDCMKAIMQSAIGEHPFEPWLGWPIDPFMVVSDADIISELVKEALINGEDQIDDRSLRVDVTIGDEGVLGITVFYSLRGETTGRTLQHGFRRQ